MSVVVTTPFRFCTIVTGLSLAALCTWLVAPMPAQGGASGDWPHDHEVRNSRFSPLDQRSA
ncbi:MAG TPA: hypothetical protein VGQ10_10500 [Vicinamibacterales bacterium]|nr:hypothetical protein [Vicinamibacterales bacterium]